MNPDADMFQVSALFLFVQVLYRTTQPFDPEGVLGTINSIVMGFFGMQVGCSEYLRKKETKSAVVLNISSEFAVTS